MPIVRIKKTENFTILSNVCLRDKRLSAKAKGIHCYLLTLPDDWVIHLNELTKHFTDKITSIRSSINELIQYGYISSYQTRNSDGRYNDVIYTAYEIPKSDFLKADELQAVNINLLKTNNTKELIEQITNKTVGEHDNFFESEKIIQNHFSKEQKNDLVQVQHAERILAVKENSNSTTVSLANTKKEKVSLSTVLERSDQTNSFYDGGAAPEIKQDTLNNYVPFAFQSGSLTYKLLQKQRNKS